MQTLEEENSGKQTLDGQVAVIPGVDIDYSRALSGPQFKAALAATFGGFVLGGALSWSSPVQPQLQPGNSTRNNLTSEDPWFIDLNNDEFSWVSSLVNFGALVGSMFGGVLMNRFGRRSIMMYMTFPSAIGWLLIAMAIDPSMLYIGRIVGGLAGGVCCVAGPAMISEITTPKMRGSLGMLFSGSICTGIVVGSVFGWLNWRIMSAILIAEPVIMFVALLCVPESPYYLIKKDRLTEAEEALQWLRGPNYDIVPELKMIESRVRLDKAQTSRFTDILHPWAYKPVFIGVALNTFQQFSGINAALFNAVMIFRLAGSSMDSLLCNFIINFVLMAGTLSSSFLVDLLGRRPLFLLSEVLTCTFVSLLGAYFYIIENDSTMIEKLEWLPLTSLVLFVGVYSIGVGPLPWLMSSEVLPANFKGPGCSIASFTNWLTSFIVTKTFVDMQQSMNTSGAFWFFAACCLVAILFGIFLLPETKGKTSEQIQLFFGIETQKPMLSSNSPDKVQQHHLTDNTE